jgi:hypothetical protein
MKRIEKAEALQESARLKSIAASLEGSQISKTGDRMD